MDTRTRIAAITLAEKLDRQPAYASRIGVSLTGLPGRSRDGDPPGRSHGCCGADSKALPENPRRIQNDG